jgi:transcriptional regulator with XRE-family HTH domain
VTDELRQQLRQLLADQGLSQAALAAMIGTDRHTVNRALAGNGNVPVIWQRMLDALGLELVLRPKGVA